MTTTNEPDVPLDQREQLDFRDEVRELRRETSSLVHRLAAVPKGALVIGTDMVQGSFRSPADMEDHGREVLAAELRKARAGLSNALLVLEGQW